MGADNEATQVTFSETVWGAKMGVLKHCVRQKHRGSPLGTFGTRKRHFSRPRGKYWGEKKNPRQFLSAT